jgi:hypothetical protein
MFLSSIFLSSSYCAERLAEIGKEIGNKKIDSFIPRHPILAFNSSISRTA